MASRTDQLARAFLDCTLPKAEWTHEAHLRVGLWHLLRHPPEETLDRLRVGITRYNLATGVANTERSGYHETITRFYVWAIRAFVLTMDRTRPEDELAAELLQTHGDRGLALRYWSKERLFSPQARREWVQPDLRPLE